MESMPPVRFPAPDSPNMSELTPAPQADFQKLDPSVRILWFIGRLIMWAFLSVIFIAVGLFGLFANAAVRPFIGLGILVLGCLALLHLIWPFISYAYWGYALRDTDILIRSGVIWKRVSAIPFSRIQHVDSDAGPIERMFGVANLVIHTAGSGMGSMGIPGIESQHAEDLRDYLSEVGHTHANL